MLCALSRTDPGHRPGNKEKPERNHPMSQENITETILPSGFEITARQLSEMESVDFLLIDIRSQSSAAYGTIPGAVLIPQSQLLAYAHKISQNEDAVSDETESAPRRMLNRLNLLLSEEM